MSSFANQFRQTIRRVRRALLFTAVTLIGTMAIHVRFSPPGRSSMTTPQKESSQGAQNKNSREEPSGF